MKSIDAESEEGRLLLTTIRDKQALDLLRRFLVTPLRIVFPDKSHLDILPVPLPWELGLLGEYEYHPKPEAMLTVPKMPPVMLHPSYDCPDESEVGGLNVAPNQGWD